MTPAVVGKEGKECTKCGEWKEYGEYTKNKNHTDGLASACKKCKKAWREKAKNREKDTPEEKECSRCEKVKKAEEFYSRKTSSDGLTSACKRCVSDRQKKKSDKLSSRSWDEIPVPDTKVCGVCDKEKTADKFGRKKKNKDGLTYCCLKCRRKRERKSRQEARKNYNGTWDEKECTSCGETKDADDFWKATHLESGLQPQCIECKESRKKKRRQENLKNNTWENAPDEKECSRCGKTKTKQEYYFVGYTGDGLTHACIECRLEWQRKDFEEDPHRHRQYKNKWARENLDKIRAEARKRQVKRFNAVLPWANEQKISKLYKTAKFLSKHGSQEYHVDHIDPLQHDKVCGLHCLLNLEIVPAKYNFSKNNKFRSGEGNQSLTQKRFNKWMK